MPTCVEPSLAVQAAAARAVALRSGYVVPRLEASWRALSATIYTGTEDSRGTVCCGCSVQQVDAVSGALHT